MSSQNFSLIITSLAGCVISVISVVLFFANNESVLLAYGITALVPATFCFLGGLRKRKILLSISVLASSGWFLGRLLAQAVVMATQSHHIGAINSHFAKNYPIIPCAVLGAIFAFCTLILTVQPRRSTSESTKNPNEGEHAV